MKKFLICFSILFLAVNLFAYGGDSLGNHKATKNLDMNSKNINNIDSLTANTISVSTITATNAYFQTVTISSLNVVNEISTNSVINGNLTVAQTATAKHGVFTSSVTIAGNLHVGNGRDIYLFQNQALWLNPLQTSHLYCTPSNKVRLGSPNLGFVSLNVSGVDKFEVSATSAGCYVPLTLDYLVANSSVTTVNGSIGIGRSDLLTSLPNGWGTGRFLTIKSIGGANGDMGVIMRRGDADTIGADVWFDGSAAGPLYIDCRYDNPASDIVFRSRTGGTPVEIMRLTGDNMVGIGGRANPTAKLDVFGDIKTSSGIVVLGSATVVGDFETYNNAGISQTLTAKNLVITSSVSFTCPVIATKSLANLKLYTPIVIGEMWVCSDTYDIYIATGITAYGFKKFAIANPD